MELAYFCAKLERHRKCKIVRFRQMDIKWAGLPYFGLQIKDGVTRDENVAFLK